LLPSATLVIGLPLAQLLIVFRFIVIPIKTATGFLLSIAASHRAVLGVFQLGLGPQTSAPAPTTGPER
jgi:RND superfamily putative drug exporter